MIFEIFKPLHYVIDRLNHFRSNSTDSDSLNDSESSNCHTPVASRQNSLLRLRLPLVINTDLTDSEQVTKERSPTSVKEVKDKILASSKIILEKVLSPTKEKTAVTRDKVSDIHNSQVYAKKR